MGQLIHRVVISIKVILQNKSDANRLCFHFLARVKVRGGAEGDFWGVIILRMTHILYCSSVHTWSLFLHTVAELSVLVSRLNMCFIHTFVIELHAH